MYKRNSRWYSDFWYEGERYTKSHGPVNKTVAKEKDRKFRADVAAGIYQKQKNDMAFDKAIDEHLKRSKQNNAPSTYTRNQINALHLKDHYGSRRISTIENNEVLINQYIKKRKQEITEKQTKQGRTKDELTFTTINRELAFLRSMFNVLIKTGKAQKNPVYLVTLFEEIQKEKILEVDEVEKILRAIDESDIRYQHLKDMVKIGLNTAMRQGEILGMKKDWIHLDQDLIIVPRFSQKRKKKDKRVPINSVTMPIIKRLMKENKKSEYLFVNRRTGRRFTTIQNSWNGILKKAGLWGKPGVDKLRFHDIRHTAATNLGRAGKDLKFIAQYLGHQDVRTSARYIHYNDDDLKAGSELLAQVPSKSTTPRLKAIKRPASS